MRYLYSIIILVSLTVFSLCYAGQAEHDDCILKYLKGAKLDVATDYIRIACEENSRSSGFISGKRKAYNNCLLENLVGVESFHAVMAISNACASKYK